MILSNSDHMALMTINDRPLIKRNYALKFRQSYVLGGDWVGHQACSLLQ